LKQALGKVSSIYYIDRKDAGTKLLPFIKKYIGQETLLFAIPRGGVAVAEPIAAYFKLPVHLLMIKKISQPGNEELAIGACGLKTFVLDERRLLNKKELNTVLHAIREKLLQRQTLLTNEVSSFNLSSKTALLIDDGAATGQTLLCGIHELKQMNPERIILAVPIASSDAEKLLKPEVDEFICPQVEEHLYAIGAFYEDFQQVTDDEVKKILRV
jgi:putative phosphoribosyl transferase